MGNSISGSLTGAGSVTLTKAAADTTTLVQISGTYGTVTFVIEGTVDGSQWSPVGAISYSTGLFSAGSSTFSPTDNATQAWKVPSEGLIGVRARATAVGSGQADFVLVSERIGGNPFFSIASSGSTVGSLTTFQAGINFTGATTVNTVSMPDNLADALNIKEATNSYLKFITTNSAEAIVLGKSLTLSQGASTAGLGTTFADAAALPAGTGAYYPTTAADGTVGVIIDVADKVSNRILFIGNGVSNAILKVYGPSGAVINGAAANAAFSSASGKGVIAICLSGAGNTWAMF